MGLDLGSMGCAHLDKQNVVRLDKESFGVSLFPVLKAASGWKFHANSIGDMGAIVAACFLILPVNHEGSILARHDFKHAHGMGVRKTRPLPQCVLLVQLRFRGQQWFWIT